MAIEKAIDDCINQNILRYSSIPDSKINKNYRNRQQNARIFCNIRAFCCFLY